MNTEGLDNMVKRLELLDMLTAVCGAQDVRVINDAGMNLTVEVVIDRQKMKDCAQQMIEKEWNGEVIRMERINKSEGGSVETGNGLYRYTIQFQKTF